MSNWENYRGDFYSGDIKCGFSDRPQSEIEQECSDDPRCVGYTMVDLGLKNRDSSGASGIMVPHCMKLRCVGDIKRTKDLFSQQNSEQPRGDLNEQFYFKPDASSDDTPCGDLDEVASTWERVDKDLYHGDIGKCNLFSSQTEIENECSNNPDCIGYTMKHGSVPHCIKNKCVNGQKRTRSDFSKGNLGEVLYLKPSENDIPLIDTDFSCSPSVEDECNPDTSWFNSETRECLPLTECGESEEEKFFNYSHDYDYKIGWYRTSDRICTPIEEETTPNEEMYAGYPCSQYDCSTIGQTSDLAESCPIRLNECQNEEETTSNNSQNEDILQFHNRVREQCRLEAEQNNLSGPGPIVWEDDLAKAASELDGIFGDSHSNYNRPVFELENETRYNLKIGENLAWTTDVSDNNFNNVYDALSEWSEEGYNGNGSTYNANGQPQGHYTLMNWNDVEKIGCSVSPDSTKLGNFDQLRTRCLYQSRSDGVMGNMPSYPGHNFNDKVNCRSKFTCNPNCSILDESTDSPSILDESTDSPCQDTPGYPLEITDESGTMRPASCSDVVDFCNDPQYGSLVSGKCPATCEACPN